MRVATKIEVVRDVLYVPAAMSLTGAELGAEIGDQFLSEGVVCVSVLS